MSAGLNTPLTGPGRAIFDVCDTLYAENTTQGFLSFWHEGRASRRAYARLERVTRARWSPLAWAHAVAWRVAHLDVARTLAIRTLRGAARDDLGQAARRYVAERLTPVANRPLHDRLLAHRAAGHEVVLVSSSLDVVIAEIAAALEVDWIASELEFRDGRCTGRLRRDLTGAKLDAIAGRFGGEAPTHVYSDNHTDRALLERAENAFVVIPAGAGRSGWQGLRASFVEL